MWTRNKIIFICMYVWRCICIHAYIRASPPHGLVHVLKDYLYHYVRMCIYVYVCVFVHKIYEGSHKIFACCEYMYVCAYLHVYVCMFGSLSVVRETYEHVFVCIHVWLVQCCMWMFISIFPSVRVYVCVYVCTHIWLAQCCRWTHIHMCHICMCMYVSMPCHISTS